MLCKLDGLYRAYYIHLPAISLADPEQPLLVGMARPVLMSGVSLHSHNTETELK